MLQEIQQDAVDDQVSLGMTLRKMRVLAARLDIEELEHWVRNESDGYPNGIELPPYRSWNIEIEGDFRGPRGSGYQKVPIPYSCIPENVRVGVTTYSCCQSVSSIESLLREGEASGNSVLRAQLPSDLILLLGENVISGMTCVQVWGVLPALHLHEVLNAVRNRVLELVTQLSKTYPNMGASSGPPPIIERERALQIFNTIVYGGNIGQIGHANESPISIVVAGDFATLSHELARHGLHQSDIDELDIAIKDEPNLGDDKRFGPRIAQWIGKMTAKAASGAWDIAVPTASTLLIRILLDYYGSSD